MPGLTDLPDDIWQDSILEFIQPKDYHDLALVSKQFSAWFMRYLWMARCVEACSAPDYIRYDPRIANWKIECPHVANKIPPFIRHVGIVDLYIESLGDISRLETLAFTPSPQSETLDRLLPPTEMSKGLADKIANSSLYGLDMRRVDLGRYTMPTTLIGLGIKIASMVKNPRKMVSLKDLDIFCWDVNDSDAFPVLHKLGVTVCAAALPPVSVLKLYDATRYQVHPATRIIHVSKMNVLRLPENSLVHTIYSDCTGGLLYPDKSQRYSHIDLRRARYSTLQTGPIRIIYSDGQISFLDLNCYIVGW